MNILLYTPATGFLDLDIKGSIRKKTTRIIMVGS